jgi:Flp pilus assembly protein TadG
MQHRSQEKGIRGFARACSGAAGLEFAFILPILMLLMIGAIELGRGLHDFHVVNESVRDAARYLSRVPASCPAATMDDANDVLVAQALAMTGGANTVSPEPDLLGYWNFPADAAATITVTVTCFANGGQFEGPLFLGETEVPAVELTANVPFTFMFGQLISPDATITLQISHKVIHIGQ